MQLATSTHTRAEETLKRATEAEKKLITAEAEARQSLRRAHARSLDRQMSSLKAKGSLLEVRAPSPLQARNVLFSYRVLRLYSSRPKRV
jgi:hypothetical protein